MTAITFSFFVAALVAMQIVANIAVNNASFPRLPASPHGT